MYVGKFELQGVSVLRAEALEDVLLSEGPAVGRTRLDPCRFVHLVAERGDLQPAVARDLADRQRRAPMKTDIDEHIGSVVEKATGAVANATRGIDRAARGRRFRIDIIDDEQSRGTVAGVLAD